MLVLWVKPIYISKGKDVNLFCLTIQVEAESQSPASAPPLLQSDVLHPHMVSILMKSEKIKDGKNAYFVNECDYPQSSECSDKLQKHDHLFSCRCSEEKLGLSPESYAYEKNK